MKIILMTGVVVAVVMGPLLTHPAEGQFLKNLKSQVQQAVEQTTTTHVSTDAANTTDKAISKVEAGVVEVVKGNPDKQKPPAGSPPQETAPETVQPDGVAPPVSQDPPAVQAVPAPPMQPVTPSIALYQHYEFVPGDSILFSEEFTGDRDGEFPGHWKLTKGHALINRVAGVPALVLIDGNYCEVRPRMRTDDYLTDPFTVEFDSYSDGDDAQSGAILFLSYLNRDQNLQDGAIEFDNGDTEGRDEVSITGFQGSALSCALPQELKNQYPNRWHHYAVIYKHGELKCYIDQYRILIDPDLGCVPLAFWFGGVGDQTHPIAITHIRVAKGSSMNLAGRKFTDAKIVTHGITFDLDQSTLKPESMGTLNMVAGVLNQNPGLKFEIDGHTDNTGSPEHNKTLSTERAQAVRDQLIQMGIDAARLTAQGFGDSKPVADNTTPDGRANNRRVEFVRR